jgi:hypothetical protein
MTLTELAEPVGVTIVNLSILKSGKARAVRFSTLERSAGCSTASPATSSPTCRRRRRSRRCSPGTGW